MIRLKLIGRKPPASAGFCAVAPDMPQLRLSTMVDYHYDENLHRRAARKRRAKVAGYALIGTLVIVVALVIFDGLRSDTTVTNQTTQQTLARTTERMVFDEELFRFNADTTWQKISSREATEFHYQSFVSNLAKRDLRIYVNEIPVEFPLTYVLPVEVEGNRIVPLSFSPHCKNLVKDKKSKRDQTVTWAGVSFLCDPDSPLYIVGTSHNQDGYGTIVEGADSRRRFFFVYRDLEPNPRLETFANLLRSFEAK